MSRDTTTSIGTAPATIRSHANVVQNCPVATSIRPMVISFQSHLFAGRKKPVQPKDDSIRHNGTNEQTVAFGAMLNGWYRDVCKDPDQKRREKANGGRCSDVFGRMLQNEYASFQQEQPPANVLKVSLSSGEGVDFGGVAEV